MTIKKKKKTKQRAFLARARDLEQRTSVRPSSHASVDVPIDAVTAKRLRQLKVVGLVFLIGIFFWAYWPTLRELVEIWNREPDYSHGFLVAPLAVYFLWMRRDRMPAMNPYLAWPGLLLIVAGSAMRVAGETFYIEAVDGWSMILWIAGTVWLFGGGRIFLWSWSSIAFLWFMVPLPYRAERMISYPLQRIATKLSCWILQSLRQPALAEGNTILLGDHSLAVEEACSGLRIFVSIIALSLAYVIVIRRAWWEKVLVLASTLPIALLVNALRIAITGLLAQYISSEAAAKFSHDLAGWLMIPLAAALFGLVLWYIAKLFPTAQQINIRSLVSNEKVKS